jgi:hypothetical protein
VESVYDNIIPYDVSYFDVLNSFVQREPWIERDRAFIDTLRSIGIEQGMPFAPDAKTKQVLGKSAAEAGALLASRYESVFDTAYFPGSRWAFPVYPEVVEGVSTMFAKPDSYPVDGRGLLYTYIYFSAKHVGGGQFYTMTIKDREGRAFDGSSTYRLNVPANPPVELYWSATVYDRATHAPIRDKARLSRSSKSPELQTNSEGSVDVYFGPSAPSGKDGNWVPTDPTGEFEVLFRFYGPKPPLFDKSWALPDIEKIS